ncbi:unnamed protein product [Diamesa hyperborea]
MMNVVLLIVILVGGSQLSNGENLNCDYRQAHFGNFWGWIYTCDVASLEVLSNDKVITGYNGVHKPMKNPNDIRAIFIHNTNTKFIPANLGQNLSIMALNIYKANLMEVKSKDFEYVPDLEYISFWTNKLTFLPADVFSTLPKLKTIYLSTNQIEELPTGLFSNNLNLLHIYLHENKLKYIGTGMFDGLTKLNVVDTSRNICMSKNYGSSTEIAHLKNDIVTKCKHPLGSIDVKLNEIMKQLLKILEEQQKNKNEIYKLRTELMKYANYKYIQ